jgi:MraZ protein
MPEILNHDGLLLGEVARALDDRYRISLPSEVAEVLADEQKTCLLAKERPGCLSLWPKAAWQQKIDDGIELVRSKIRTGRLEGRIADVQALGRLLSTRHREVTLAGRGRLVLPEGFREFLGVVPGDDVMVVGAAVCLELWHPEKWAETIGEQMPDFRQLFDGLTA